VLLGTTETSNEYIVKRIQELLIGCGVQYPRDACTLVVDTIYQWSRHCAQRAIHRQCRKCLPIMVVVAAVTWEPGLRSHAGTVLHDIAIYHVE
jgi:arginyl-tRNA--protein-N-Asp/Glu arginylyltransferase